MAEITANGISSHQLGGTSNWPPGEFFYLSLTALDPNAQAPQAPFNVYPSWRRPWRILKAT